MHPADAKNSAADAFRRQGGTGCGGRLLRNKVPCPARHPRIMKIYNLTRHLPITRRGSAAKVLGHLDAPGLIPAGAGLSSPDLF